MAHKLSNIPLRTLQKFLKAQGLTVIRTNGGHQTWYRPGLTRGITLQTHITPVPQFIVKQILTSLSITKEAFLSSL